MGGSSWFPLSNSSNQLLHYASLFPPLSGRQGLWKSCFTGILDYVKLWIANLLILLQLSPISFLFFVNKLLHFSGSVAFLTPFTTTCYQTSSLIFSLPSCFVFFFVVFFSWGGNRHFCRGDVSLTKAQELMTAMSDCLYPAGNLRRTHTYTGTYTEIIPKEM